MTPSRFPFRVRAASAALLLVAACFTKKPVPCAQDGTCADGLACIGKVCTQPAHLAACQAGTDCAAAGTGEACLRLDGARADAAICARPCSGDADCGTGQLCATGTTLGGGAKNGCIPECQLSLTDCAAMFNSPALQCRVLPGGRSACTPGMPADASWTLVSGWFETAQSGAAASGWKLVEAGFEISSPVCNQTNTLCVEGGFTP
jgi:hypothetical protein